LPRYYLARCRLALGDAEAALKAAEDTLEHSPDEDLEHRTLATRGAALHHLERFDEAAAAYRLAGDEEKAREMEHWAEVKRTNETSRAHCEARRAELESLLEESRDLEGTETWKALKREYETFLDSCAAFFLESSS
jgi:tetratricopeptide (TPR) repeat protein